MKVADLKFKEVEKKYKRILNEFTEILDITPADLIKPDKSEIMCEIRHLYCKLRCENHEETLTKVSTEIKRDRTTLGRGLKRINNLLFFEDKRVVAMWELVKDIPKESDVKSLKADTNTFPWEATVGLPPIALRQQNDAIIFPLAP